MNVSRERFEALVAEALDGLPRWVEERLDNVEVILEDEPPPGQPWLLGVYQGIPLTRRGIGYAGVLPDRIMLFRGSIQRTAGDETELKEAVRHTVVHEIAHFFGISDQRLRDLGRY